MKYNISVFVRFLSDEIIKDWTEKFKRYGLNCEIFPKFSFSNHSGFLPVKTVVQEGIIPNYHGESLISGFDLYVYDYMAEKEVLEACDPATREVLQRATKQLNICINYDDSLEFRLGMLSSVILAELLDGLVLNPQIGCFYAGSSMHSDILREIEKDDNHSNQYGWNLHIFNGWK